MPRERSTLLTRFFVRGIAALLPTMLTVFIVYRIADFVHQNLGQPINDAIGGLPFVNKDALPVFLGDAVGVLFILLACMMVGFVLTSFIGRRMFAALERWLVRLPVLRTIYHPIKQVTDFFLTDQTRAFSRVVAVEYPRRGCYSLGFVTGGSLPEIRTPSGEMLVSVFIPSSPTPITGYVILFPESEIRPLDLTVDDVLRFTISGGVLSPDKANRMTLPSTPVPDGASDDPPPTEKGDSV